MKDAELKKKTGTYQRCRDRKPVEVAGKIEFIPEQPESITDELLPMWDGICEYLVEQGYLYNHNLWMVEALILAQHTWMKCLRTNLDNNKELNKMNVMSGMVKSFASQLMISPVAMQKAGLGIAKKAEEVDPFAAMKLSKAA